MLNQTLRVEVVLSKKAQPIYIPLVILNVMAIF